MNRKRRHFIKVSLSGMALGTLPIPLFSAAWAQFNVKNKSDLLPPTAGPIQSINEGTLFSQVFGGDDLQRAHEILWNTESFIKSRGGIPKPSEETKILIIGGGLSGLSTAYFLRDHNPIILEQDKFFGGNAKGESYKDAHYTLGSTYLSNPEAGGDISNFLNELGILSMARKEAGDDTTVFYKGKFFHGFWKASTDTRAKKQFQKIYKSLKSIYDSGVTDPLYEGSVLSAKVKELDRISFAQWLLKNHGKVHAHIMEYFQLYSWSAFLASIDEVSAIQMLSFIAAETAEIVVFPGGNAAISQALYTNLSVKNSSNLRNESFVVDVRNTPNGVEVCYDGKDRKLKTIKAQFCVFASPKFIAKKVIRGLDEKQFKAMNEISYRSYLVGNIIIDQPVKAPNFELYCLKGKMPAPPTPTSPYPHGFTDLCFATWAQANETQHGVLTVYNALAYDGARQLLLDPHTHDKFRDQILKDIEPILKSLKLSHKNIKGLRMTRWGHAMPLARVGMLSSGTAEAAHQAIQKKIYFVNQDNLVNPCFESVFRSMKIAVEEIKKQI